jgi:farnesyl diphosphate synthase
MGHFFQVQDDFLDCFGDVSVTGKVGTDIQDCKCSWLFVTALERASPEQRKVLLENYGKNIELNIKRVKELYMEMRLPELYEQYEQQTFQTISAHIQQMSPVLPKKLFTEMLGKIYQRCS